MLTADALPLSRVKFYIFLFCALFIAWRVAFVPLRSHEKSRNSVRGDGQSAVTTMTSAKYFYRHGFWHTYLLPVHAFDEKDPKNVRAYTHYPPLPQILAGIYASITNSEHEIAIRAFPGLISLGLFFLIFAVLNRLLPSSRTAFWSAAILVTSNYYLAWADSISEHMYEELFRWALVGTLLIYYQGHKQQRWAKWTVILLYMVGVNISFTIVLYGAVLILGFSFVFERKFFSQEILLFGGAGVVGLGLHFLQNSIYFGSLAEAWNDLMHAGMRRSVGTPGAETTVSLSTLWQVPLMWLTRLERYFHIPGYAFLVLASLGLRELKKDSKIAFELAIVFLIATLTWSVVFPQHAMVHHFTTRHIGIFYGTVIGYGLIAYSKWLAHDWKGKHTGKLFLHGIFIFYVSMMCLTQQIWDLYFEHGFLYQWKLTSNF